MIRVNEIAKRYGEIRAVDGVSFEVRPGEIFGLLGPNGAGKTTTISMLAGLIAPDRGEIRVDDIDLAAAPEDVKARLGVVPQEPALYEDLTARENLRFWAGMYGLRGAALQAAVDRSLAAVGLAARADEPVKRFSGGLKRRLNLSLGLVHGPKAVLMDEPTVGIDPQARLNVLGVVREVADAGAAVLYTTHYLEEAERLCDRVGIMDHGKILAMGTLDELKRRLGGEDLVTVRGGFTADEARALLERLPGGRAVAVEPGRLVVRADAGGAGGAALLARVFGEGLPVDAVSVEPPSLNGLFLELTGRELRD